MISPFSINAQGYTCDFYYVQILIDDEKNMEITKAHQYQVTVPVEVIRFDGEKAVSLHEAVCTEEMATIILNGETIVSLAITPDNLEAFAYGHLVCEGWIPSGHEITSIRVGRD